jgi:hypothetical protein
MAKISRQSLFATRRSLFATRRRFGSAGASPSHFVFRSIPPPTPLVPLKVGAQFLRHQLQVETRSMEFHVFAPSPKAFHATGFSQWLLTKFSERRIHSASGRANLSVSQN